ncbi:Membrane-anchored ubiquitin-fold protein 4, partial [Bienertia sinuspersici]
CVNKVFCFLFISDTKVNPKAVNDFKIISGGKILENSKTVNQCQMPFNELQKSGYYNACCCSANCSKNKSRYFEHLDFHFALIISFSLRR